MARSDAVRKEAERVIGWAEAVLKNIPDETLFAEVRRRGRPGDMKNRFNSWMSTTPEASPRYSSFAQLIVVRASRLIVVGQRPVGFFPLSLRIDRVDRVNSSPAVEPGVTLVAGLHDGLGGELGISKTSPLRVWKSK